jgi:glycine/D-amino acid oxidase-like deaminating enzyme
MLAKMIARAVSFVPGLATLHVVRSWVGFRAATNDHLPVIGPMPGQPSHIVAAGHEGLGITTSLATAELVAHHVCGVEPVISPEPYLPGRFAA